jgi:hypothetical protein
MPGRNNGGGALYMMHTAVAMERLSKHVRGDVMQQ